MLGAYYTCEECGVTVVLNVNSTSVNDMNIMDLRLRLDNECNGCGESDVMTLSGVEVYYQNVEEFYDPDSFWKYDMKSEYPEDFMGDFDMGLNKGHSTSHGDGWLSATDANQIARQKYENSVEDIQELIAYRAQAGYMNTLVNLYGEDDNAVVEKADILTALGYKVSIVKNTDKERVGLLIDWKKG